MKSYLQSIRASLNEVISIANPITLNDLPGTGIQKLKGVILLIIGYLLSPLCWWNDLIFNLPIAYGFGYLCSWVWPDLLLPASIVGYWLSNLVGIILMQMGAIKVLQKQSQDGNFKKDLISGFISSTAYTVVIVLLIQLKIIEIPQLF